MDGRVNSLHLQLLPRVSLSAPRLVILLNLVSSARPLPIEMRIQSFTIPHFPSLMIAMSKPAYLAIKDFSETKPVIIFVPSRKQCSLTAQDILTHCLADAEENRFLNVEEAEIERHLEHVSDRLLQGTLKHGVGFYHEALNRQDKRIVENLFKAGAIQVIVASRVSRAVVRENPFTHVTFHCRKPPGAYPCRVTWSSSWEPNSLKAKNIVILTTPSRMSCK